MATYVLTFLGVVAVASTVVGLVGACVVAAAEWIQRQALSRRTDLADSSAYEPQPFTEAYSEYDVGIAADHHSRIFERFGRAVSAKHYGGLGLGLYICRRIVEAHGGSIRVTSTLGAGASFCIDLPGVQSR